MLVWLLPPALALSALPVALEDAQVEGIGAVPIESDYLPRVVACENGAAEPAALVAQAIAARSYLYYELGRTGMIDDGPSAQVYSCGREPEDQHYAAVEESRHEVLSFADEVIAAFHVAGAVPSDSSCVASTTDLDPTGTERYVTYNKGRRGLEIEQTSLGFIDPNNLANRGCMSQNGSRCLARGAASAELILRFYYGEDIQLQTLDGAALGAPGDDGAGCRCVAGIRSSERLGILLLAPLLLSALRRRARPQLRIRS